MREFKINENEAGQRFDKYLKKLLGNAPGSFIYKMLRKKNITLNGKKADGTEKLNQGDDIKLFFSDETFEKFSGSGTPDSEFEALKVLSREFTSGKRKLPVVYEDKDVIFINKPTGMLSQKAKPEDISANEYILAYLIAKGELTESSFRTFRPSICNRLDRNTSGILICGKTYEGLKEMNALIKERRIGKFYRCIVTGSVNEKITLTGYLAKDEKTNKVTLQQTSFPGASYIETSIVPIRQYQGGLSLLEIHLITGKTHQIRAHLASIGHPILGDYKYGNRKLNDRYGIKSQLLHAYRLEFPALPGDDPLAPLSGKVFTAPAPDSFSRIEKQ